MKNSKTEQIGKIKELLENPVFAMPKWGDIKYEEYGNGMNPQLVANDLSNNRLIKINGVKLEDITLIRHLHSDLQKLLGFLQQNIHEENSKDVLLQIVKSDEFQEIRWRDEFASTSPWHYSLESQS